jgi:hypothetical protein
MSKIPDGTVVRVTDRYAACNCDSHPEPTECATIREMLNHPGEVLQSFRRWWIFGQRMYCVVMDVDVPNPVMYFTADEVEPTCDLMRYVY